jgi:hypothetical protein
VNYLAVVFRKRFTAIFTDAKRVIKTGFTVCLPVQQWQSPEVITCIVGFYEFAATVTLDKSRFDNFLLRRRDNSRLFHSFVPFRVFVLVTGNAGPVP